MRRIVEESPGKWVIEETGPDFSSDDRERWPESDALSTQTASDSVTPPTAAARAR
jgi:hypothetical protein